MKSMCIARNIVAPLAGAWIEIRSWLHNGFHAFVALLAGAWIEMMISLPARTSLSSLPSRERGLKCYHIEWSLIQKKVAPLAGAWIEIISGMMTRAMIKRRSPRGSVD